MRLLVPGSESGKAEAVTAEVGGFQICATAGEPQIETLTYLHMKLTHENFKCRYEKRTYI